MNISQAQLLIGNQLKAIPYINKLKNELQTKPYNVLTFETRLKISDAREIKLFFSKLGTEKEKRVVILLDGATLDAQNALLKTLEEIPTHAYVWWLAESEHDVLPTILSRCTVIMLEQDFVEPEHTILEQYVRTIVENNTLSTKTALLIGEHIQTVDDYSLLLQVLEKVLKSHVKENRKISPFFIEILENISQQFSIIESNNVSPRLTVEAILLSKSNIKITS